MKKEDKSNALARLRDAEEFINSARVNLNDGRFKASLDHSIDAVIAANDAFTIHFIEQVASYDHLEAINLHKLAGQKISENRASDIAILLEERHKKTYRTFLVSKNLAESILKKSEKFLDWVKLKINI